MGRFFRSVTFAIRFAAGLALAITGLGSFCVAKGPADFVIQISVDGGGSNYIQRCVDDGALPNFKRLRSEGACTNNARTDYDFTVTLPNHTCMITGRPVYDKPGQPAACPGHVWTGNGLPGDATLHGNAHAYIHSAFDVAHDHGLGTSLYATKAKFILYGQSYDAAHGAPDAIGKNDGRRKIDVSLIDRNALAATRSFVSAMTEKPPHYSFVHFADPDTAGHAHGWGSPEYCTALKDVDSYLGMIFAAIDAVPKLKNHSAIILTADHGGLGHDHSDKTAPPDYTIPFYVWGAGVAKNADLYELNPTTRRDPGAKRPDYSSSELPPIRNGDAGNLALRLLGLGPIPESSINAKQDLATDTASRVSPTN